MDQDGVTIEYVTREEGEALLDRKAQERFGISGQEFARRYYAGEFPDYCDRAVQLTALLLPLAGLRKEPQL